MSEVIVGSLIGGICTIIGGIISPIITFKLKEFSKKSKISKENIKDNKMTPYYMNKDRARNYNIRFKRFLVAITYTILFLLGIIIYIILFQLLPKKSENVLLQDKVTYLNNEIDRLNNELTTYEKQINSIEFADLKIRLSKDAVYTLDLLQTSEWDEQNNLLDLYYTFVQLLYELEKNEDVDLKRLLDIMEKYEETLEYYNQKYRRD